MGDANSEGILRKQVSRRKFLIQSGVATVGAVGLYTTPVIRTVFVKPAFASATPVATPEVCSVVNDPAYINKKKATTEVTNTGGVAAVLVEFHIQWEAGAANCLKKVKLNGDFYVPAAVDCTGNATLSSGFVADVAKRTIAAGVTEKLEFEFESDLDPNYAFQGWARFDNDCVIFFDYSLTECTTKIASMQLRYTGATALGAALVFDPDNGAGFTTDPIDLVQDTTVVEFPMDAADFGAKVRISINDVVEELHTSCSTPFEANAPAPLNSPKGDPSPNWFVVSFTQKV